jgi:hypothetical protein
LWIRKKTDTTTIQETARAKFRLARGIFNTAKKLGISIADDAPREPAIINRSGHSLGMDAVKNAKSNKRPYPKNPIEIIAKTTKRVMVSETSDTSFLVSHSNSIYAA